MEFIVKRVDPSKKDDELLHSGVKGMHWYVRQYQLPGGALTDEGREHYRKMAAERRKAQNSSFIATPSDVTPGQSSLTSKWGVKRTGAVSAQEDERKKAYSDKIKALNSLLDNKWTRTDSVEYSYIDRNGKKVEVTGTTQELLDNQDIDTSTLKIYRRVENKSPKDAIKEMQQKKLSDMRDEAREKLREAAENATKKESLSKITREVKATNLSDMTEEQKEKIRSAAKKAYDRKKSSGNGN